MQKQQAVNEVLLSSVLPIAAKCLTQSMAVMNNIGLFDYDNLYMIKLAMYVSYMCRAIWCLVSSHLARTLQDLFEL